MTRILLAVIVLLAGVPSLAVEVKHKGDTMSQTPETNPDSLLAEADSVFQERKYEEAGEIYARAVEAARSDFNRPVETEALAQMARVRLIAGETEAGRGILAEAAAKAADDDPMGWSRYLGVKGRFEWKEGNLDEARKTFDQMYVYCNTNALWGRSVDAAHMMAIVAEDLDGQIEWSKKGIDIAESAAEEKWLGPLWNNLGVTYHENKMFTESLDAFKKARVYHWQHSGELGKLYADYHVGMSYLAVGELDEAATWLRPVLAWAERLGDHSAIGQACEDLGEIAVAKGDRDGGIELLKRARDEYKAAGFDQTWKDIWDGINKRLDDLGVK